MSDSTPVTRALAALGIPCRLFRHPAPIQSVEQAAAERSQVPDQVVRSILFHLGGGEYAMMLIAGKRRVDWGKLRRYLGQSRLTMASEDEVLEVTGYAVGTVAPFGLRRPVRILLDESALAHAEISFGSGEAGAGVIMRSDDFARALGEVERGRFESDAEGGV